MIRLLVPLAAGIAVAAVVFAAVPGDDDPAPAAQKPVAAAKPAQGRALFAEMGCGSCHTFRAAGSNGEFGPDLDERLSGYTRDALRQVIVEPPASIMPTDFGRRMTAAELDTLAGYLIAERARP